jgi:Protein of unknown function (DUF4012)
MARAGKKPQLRTCSVCNKPGHNKSRCPDFLRTRETKNVPAPALKMFIYEAPRNVASPHLVNLKHKHNPWEDVGSFSPEQTVSAYQNYQNAFHSPMPEKIQTLPRIDEPSVQLIRPKNSPSIFVSLRERYESWQEDRATQKTLIKMESKFSEIEKIEEAKDMAAQVPLTAEERLADLIADAMLIQFYRDVEINEKRRTASSEHPMDFKHLFWKMSWRAAILIALLVVPFQANSYYRALKTTTGQIAADGTEGFMALQDSTAAIMQSNLTGAEDSVLTALNKFNRAIEAMNSNHQLLQKIASAVPVVSNEVQSRQKLITAGQKIALGNTYLIKGLSESQANASSTLTDKIALVTAHLKAAVPNYRTALDDLSAVDAGVLPLEYQSSFKDFRLLFSTFLNDLDSLVELGEAVNEVFGGQGLRRYLLVFQNPHEIRPTGGFLGSYAIIDIKDGKISDLNIPPGGSYALRGQLDESVEPPTPLLLSNKRWEFQDANWFPDFPASAEKMMWFYRHSRNVTVDGVIAVNATVLERLLSVIGPITDLNRSIELTATSAVAIIQQVVEEGPEKKDNKPKQILADLAPQFINYLYGAKAEQILPLMINLSDALEKKEIQAYFTDLSVEKTVKDFGWAGQILPSKDGQDYLAVINANIQGQKSDAEIKQTITHQAVVSEDGTVLDTVVITREHTGIPGTKLYGQTNINYVRVYVPQGSELISAGGFTWPDERKFRAPDPWTTKDAFLTAQEKEIKYDETTGTRITNEFGKTAFANWIILEPGESRQVQFTYRLPFKVQMDYPQASEQNFVKKLISEDYLTSRYQLIIQRQSGQDSDFESQIIYPSPWRPSWSDGGNVALAANGIGIGIMSLDTDNIWSLVMKKER